jgi:adenylate kinase family enzyme
LAARLAAVLGVPHVELDAVFHQPGWQELDRDRFQDEVRALSAGDGWVIDGNYSAVREIVWRRADTVVFLDLPRRRVMRSVITRSVSRVLRRTELWNGNRETVANVLHPPRFDRGVGLDPTRQVREALRRGHARSCVGPPRLRPPPIAARGQRLARPAASDSCLTGTPGQSVGWL